MPVRTVQGTPGMRQGRPLAPIRLETTPRRLEVEHGIRHGRPPGIGAGSGRRGWGVGATVGRGGT
ncbi:hypothetical protein CPCC7001_1590 [Cyanobium sp. PCC 7001]|nr:hypothetical protein CPCC7001_1590 [Cyanobium sp. PCC 7001]